MVGKRVGHTFSKHGRHNTKELTLNAKNSGNAQGQWLVEEAAEELIADNLDKLKNGAVDVSIPSGVGRMIMPDGSFKPATKARLVPSGNGVKTAYPVLE